MKADASRDYQDTPYPDFRKHVGIWADLERLRPKGDCVLIRVMPEIEMHANLIWIPETVRGKGDNSPRVGEVVGVGLGDRLITWRCEACERMTWVRNVHTTNHAAGKCPWCGCQDWWLEAITRHPMHVKPGDRVYFWRVFANQVIIEDQVYQFVREQQHILAVLDKEVDNANN